MGWIASNGRRQLLAVTFLLVAAPCVFSGCVSNQYELEMSVEGETLQRRLVCSRVSQRGDSRNLQSMPDEELQRIATVYGVETPENEAREFEFSADFTGRTPDDVGGAGSLTMYVADLGRTWAYVERFRGDDELATTLAGREQVVDDVVDAVTHWLNGELGDTRDFNQVRDLLDGTLRNDLHNVAAYSWLTQAIGETGAEGDPAVEFEMLVRLGQFGLERDYVRPADLPELVQVANGQDGTALLAMIRRLLTTKLGPDVRVDEWKFLDSPENVASSISEHLRDYPPYEVYLTEWRGKRENHDPSDEPKPTDWMGGLVLRALGISFGGGDALRVSLHCPTRPFRTNGEWSAEEGVVLWDKRFEPRDADSESPRSVLPVELFAFWSVPDDALQTEHFGRVVLRDERLAEYVMWRQSLPPPEAAEWEDFITGLRPNSILRGRIEVFRFSSDPPDGESGTVLSSRGRELILAGLDDEP
jgi:hypothetical protein